MKAGTEGANIYMNLEEYREWLKQNANKEEASAYEVAEEIINYHNSFWGMDEPSKVELFPRKVITHNGDRLEFDLVIVISWVRDVFHYKMTYTRTIGVEFKESDISKVIQQAIKRRDYVEYMYIATRNGVLNHLEHILMAEFGIGWVVWDDGFAKMVIPSHYQYPVHSIMYIVEHLVKKAVDKYLEEKMKEVKVTKLTDFEDVEVDKE